MNKGFIISFEAGLSLIMFSLILISFSFPNNESFKDLIVLQQSNDLLKIWSKNFPTEDEMINDASQFFKNASILINKNELTIGKKCLGNNVASEAIIFDDHLNKKNVRIIVYLNC